MNKSGKSVAGALALVGVVLSASLAQADPYAYQPCCATQEYNWSGFYVGGHAGAAYSQIEWTITPGVREDQSDTLFAGGAHAGLQYQWKRFVAGFEVSFTWADTEFSSGSNIPPGTRVATSLSNLILATGRFGYAYERWLAYAKAGYATADVDWRSTVGLATTLSNGREHGWTAGIGVDMVITPRISIGVEYDYVRFNADHLNPAGAIADAGVDIQLFMARLNFRFGRDEPPDVK
jgi:outer membrane immunogenic protein